MSSRSNKPSETKRHIGPYYEQEPFLEQDKRYYGFISGVGAGKTAVGVLRTAMNAKVWNRGSMGAIVAPSTRMIKNAIFPVLKEFGLRSDWDFNGFQAEEPGFQTEDGGRIVILSADNERTVERLANLNLAYWWLDEAKETPRRAREVLIERLRIGDYRNGYITTTPNGFDHNYDFFVGEPEDDGQLEKTTRGDSTVYRGYDDRICIGGVPSWANPHTPDDYHESMRNLPEKLRLQQAEGQFVQLGSGVFDREMLQFATPEDLPNRDLQYSLAVDVGVESDSLKANERDSDYWAITAFAVDSLEPRGWVIDCHRKRGMSLKQGVSWIKSVAATMPSNCPIYVESNQAQRWLQQELSDQGLRAIPVNHTESKEDRLIQLSIPLERGTVKFLNRPPGDASKQEFEEWKRYYESHGYAPRWEDMIQELLAFPNGAHDDLIDSLETVVDNADIGGAANSFMGGGGEREDAW